MYHLNILLKKILTFSSTKKTITRERLMGFTLLLDGLLKEMKQFAVEEMRRSKGDVERVN